MLYFPQLPLITKDECPQQLLSARYGSIGVRLCTSSNLSLVQLVLVSFLRFLTDNILFTLLVTLFSLKLLEEESLGFFEPVIYDLSSFHFPFAGCDTCGCMTARQQSSEEFTSRNVTPL